ncbi:spore germination protein GerPC [Thermicanus aegyptius]|uniref:spore germination protein GerPC n=1 Tax=Thermicanus aegyptius TaxID=94009 RepID=UPI0004101EAA|nr:spore germination protein GerPC [Thermicanus aegyptius]
MYTDPYVESYLLQVSEYLKQQYEKIVELEREIVTLRQGLEELQMRPPFHIDKMEYKFDQLKIETLEGTLNIGISPENGRTLKEISLGKQNLTNPHPDWDEEKEKRFREVKEEMDRFLKEEIPPRIIALAKEAKQKIDPFAVSFITEDLKNQVEDRLRHYILIHPEWTAEKVTTKTKEDLMQAVRDFIAIWPKMEE